MELTEHKKRRRNIFNQIPDDSVVLLAAAAPVMRNGGTNYRYRADSNFVYVTGVPGEPCFALLWKDKGGAERYWLFVDGRDATRARWEGVGLTVEDAISCYGSDDGFLLADLEPTVKSKIGSAAVAYVSGAAGDAMSDRLRAVAQSLGATVEAVEPLVHELRLYKSRSELRAMSRAASVSLKGHAACMKLAEEGRGEYDLHAELLKVFYQHKMEEAYPSIVAGGEHACILHYQENRAPLKKG